ncbi:hypothetical protein [Mixta mediterraneensis]|uniref:hypothetical protein n=1 Tax=Mixta mediterraneensis TaxID=2758443 RepID=UPI001874B9BD|nr:hypothetical protein [Mixta mediterraneensis]MBE5251769.1 hypothetical protein [Mixta mediterraneensis]
MTQHEMANLNDTLVKASVKIDDGRDHSQCLVWRMNQKRHIRNGVVVPKPEAPQVAPVHIEPKKKPRKRGHRVVQQAIGAV